jgi:hypothetical protein
MYIASCYRNTINIQIREHIHTRIIITKLKLFFSTSSQSSTCRFAIDIPHPELKFALTPSHTHGPIARPRSRSS